MFQCDLKDRRIDSDEIEAVYKKYQFIGWTETSAKVFWRQCDQIGLFLIGQITIFSRGHIKYFW